MLRLDTMRLKKTAEGFINLTRLRDYPIRQAAQFHTAYPARPLWSSESRISQTHSPVAFSIYASAPSPDGALIPALRNAAQPTDVIALHSLKDDARGVRVPHDCCALVELDVSTESVTSLKDSKRVVLHKAGQRSLCPCCCTYSAFQA